MTRLACALLTLLCCSLAEMEISLAADYPSRPIKIIVPWPAGGIADLRARQIGERLSKALGQPLVIENKGGAGGRSALRWVRKRPRTVTPLRWVA